MCSFEADRRRTSRTGRAIRDPRRDVSTHRPYQRTTNGVCPTIVTAEHATWPATRRDHARAAFTVCIHSTDDTSRNGTEYAGHNRVPMAMLARAVAADPMGESWRHRRHSARVRLDCGSTRRGEQRATTAT